MLRPTGLSRRPKAGDSRAGVEPRDSCLTLLAHPERACHDRRTAPFPQRLFARGMPVVGEACRIRRTNRQDDLVRDHAPCRVTTAPRPSRGAGSSACVGLVYGGRPLQNHRDCPARVTVLSPLPSEHVRTDTIELKPGAGHSVFPDWPTRAGGMRRITGQSDRRSDYPEIRSGNPIVDADHSPRCPTPQDVSARS